MKYITIIFGIGLLLFGSCRKDGKGCWQGWDHIGAVDAAGYLACDKTKAQAEEQFGGIWVYRQGETKYCYRSTKGTEIIYWANVPESIKERYAAHSGAYGTNFTKIDCSSFCHCTWRERQQSKITGNYGPVIQYKETFTNADTCSTLFIGRIITVRETSDSLITRELIDKKP